MMDYNRVELIGRLGADPVVRHNRAGEPIVSLSVATGEKWKDKNTGEDREVTEWTPVSVFDNPAKVAEAYLTKGSRVFVAGKLRTEKYTKDGVEKSITKVVVDRFGLLILLDKKGDHSGTPKAPSAKAPPEDTSFDDDIPF